MGDLGTDMHLDSSQMQSRIGVRPSINRRDLLKGNAKLVGVRPGGDFGMTPRLHVRIHPQSDGGTSPLFATRDRSDLIQLLLAFDMKSLHPKAQAKFNFVLGLPYARKNASLHLAPHLAHTFQLSPTDHIKTTPQPRQDRQNSQITVRLDRVADQGVHRTQHTPQSAIVIHDRAGGINV